MAIDPSSRETYAVLTSAFKMASRILRTTLLSEQHNLFGGFKEALNMHCL